MEITEDYLQSVEAMLGVAGKWDGVHILIAEIRRLRKENERLRDKKCGHVLADEFAQAVFENDLED